MNNMKQLLVIKEKIKKFVGKNEVLILPLLKFILTFLALNRISSKMGYMTKLANPAIVLIVALAGSFLPVNLTLVILALITTAHVYALSFECAILVFALFLVMFLLYFRFASKDSAGTLLVPLSFVFKVPYVMPVAMGLVGTLSSVVSVGCGVVTYYVLHYINVNADTFSGKVPLESKMSAFKTLIDGILGNKAMIVCVVAFCATVLLVYLVRRMSINYSWFLAIVGGSILDFFMILVFGAALKADISYAGAFFGAIISIILNIILQYFCFDLDYNRTEKVQFEDDEYYYYVKAVPKNTIKLSDKNKKKRPAAKKSQPVKKAEPVRTRSATVRKPVSTDTVVMNTKATSSTTAREAVRANAAKAATRATARPSGKPATSKGPLGMSGGRPAGEGRKKD